MQNNKIGIACMFRHDPDVDGNMIPASTFHHGHVDPVLGYLVATDGKMVVKSFVKYEAPSYRLKAVGGKLVVQPGWRRANIGTTRAGWTECPSCSDTVPVPVRGGKDDRGTITCPCCGARGCRTRLIVEKDEFDDLAGDMSKELVRAAEQALVDNTEFLYPDVVVGGTGLAPDPSVDPKMQGFSQEKGRGLISLRNVKDVAELMNLGDEDDLDLSIVPGCTSGTLDLEEVRAGKGGDSPWREGVIQWYLKVGCFPDKKRSGEFRNFRY